MRTNVPLLLSSLVAVVAAENNFLASCTEVRGDGSSQSRIWSCCPTRPGSTKSLTFLDLNNCLLNNFGNLGWLPNGGYLGSCSGCHVSGSEYICNCGNGRGQIQTTSINLNDGVANINGVLQCNGARGFITGDDCTEGWF